MGLSVPSAALKSRSCTVPRCSPHPWGSDPRPKQLWRRQLPCRPHPSCPSRLPQRAAAALPQALQHIDMAAVSATSQASLKLLILCAVVAWLAHRDMLPPETSRVLSQVSFCLTIPAALVVTTTQTLSGGTDLSLLAVPLVAGLQVLLGAVLGRLAGAAVEGRLGLTRALFGWKELHPTESAAAIAAITAAALRVPGAVEALIPHNQKPPGGLPQLVQLCCTFGSTLTLPLLFITGMMGGEAAAAALGSTSLFHAAWSPLFWVGGYNLLLAAGQARQAGAVGRRRGLLWPLIRGLQTLFQRLSLSGPDPAAATAGAGPGAGGQAGPSGSSSSSRSSRFGQTSDVLIARQVSPGVAGQGGQGSRPAVFAVPTSSDEEDPYESPAEMLFRRVWKAVNAVGVALLGQGGVRQLKKALNPPVVAVLAGVCLGLSPLSPLLTDPAAGPAFIAAHAPQPGVVAWELSVLLGVAGSFWSTLQLLADTALAMSALVLASSLFGRASGSNRGASSQEQQQQQQQREQEGWAGEPRMVGMEDPSSSSSGSGGMQTGWEAGSNPAAPEAGRVEVVGADGSTLMEAGEGTGFTGTPKLSSLESSINLVHKGAETPDDASESVLDQLRPRGAWEWRVLLAVAAVRFLLMPLACTGLVMGAAWAGLLPASRACLFALLLQGAMPPAQELVLLLQLQPRTAKLASSAARLLLQLYFVGIVPVTLWVSAFASWASSAAAAAGSGGPFLSGLVSGMAL